MKSIKYFFFAIAVIFITFTGCKKNDQMPTALEIRLIDEQGNYVTGATVKLYKSLADIQNDTNQFGTTQTSDANGKVTFSNLAAVTYYWFAEKGCQNNINGITTTGALDPNNTKIVTSTLSSTGTLELKNQSQDQYQVYVNGYLLLTADAVYLYSYMYVPADSYSIRILQVGGSIDKTYTGIITCGSTLTITFP
jgi:hypothetical protein